MRMAAQALPPEAMIAFRDFITIVDELENLCKKVDDAVSAANARSKGEPGDPAPAVDLDLLARKVVALMPQPRHGRDGVDGADVNEKALEARLYGRLVAALPPPEKGEPGEPGESAVIDHEELAGAVVGHIREKKALTVEHIGGLKEQMDSYWQRVKRQFSSGIISGGGDSVTAGTNVTITTVAGRKVISATAGTGFTALTATGTVDGSNAAFTFVSKPTYIIADGAWYVENTGWTWNSGTLTATMSVPPQTNVFGFV